MKKLILIFLIASSAFAQRDGRIEQPSQPRDGGFQISPLITETHIGNKPGSKVSGTFTVRNESASTPAAVIVQVTQLAVDADGKPIPGPKANQCLKLSETSTRIGPKTGHTFSWRATCMGAFEIVASSIDARKITSGLGLRIGLGTAVYVEGPAITREDLIFSWPDPQTLIVTNKSDKLSRFSEVKYWTGAVFQQNGAEPLFPNSKLQIHFEHAPDKVELITQSGKFTVAANGGLL